MKTEGNAISPKYMMATKAFHQLGEISSDSPDICIVRSETETDYFGNWVFGLGFFGVRFPKESTRELTEAEVQEYNGQKLAMYGAFSGNHSYDCGQINVK